MKIYDKDDNDTTEQNKLVLSTRNKKKKNIIYTERIKIMQYSLERYKESFSKDIRIHIICIEKSFSYSKYIEEYFQQVILPVHIISDSFTKESLMDTLSLLKKILSPFYYIRIIHLINQLIRRNRQKYII